MKYETISVGSDLQTFQLHYSPKRSAVFSQHDKCVILFWTHSLTRFGFGEWAVPETFTLCAWMVGACVCVCVFLMWVSCCMWRSRHHVPATEIHSSWSPFLTSVLNTYTRECDDVCCSECVCDQDGYLKKKRVKYNHTKFILEESAREFGCKLVLENFVQPHADYQSVLHHTCLIPDK